MRKSLLPLAETVRFRAPAGFGAMLSAAAVMDCSTMSAFIRRACLEKLRATAPRLRLINPPLTMTAATTLLYLGLHKRLQRALHDVPQRSVRQSGGEAQNALVTGPRWPWRPCWTGRPN